MYAYMPCNLQINVFLYIYSFLVYLNIMIIKPKWALTNMMATKASINFYALHNYINGISSVLSFRLLDFFFVWYEIVPSNSSRHLRLECTKNQMGIMCSLYKQIITMKKKLHSRIIKEFIGCRRASCISWVISLIV